MKSSRALDTNIRDPLPPLSLGTYQLEGTQCKAVILDALRLGWRGFDTSAFYGNETWIGEAIREVC